MKGPDLGAIFRSHEASPREFEGIGQQAIASVAGPCGGEDELATADFRHGAAPGEAH